jgi:16S rRNA (cytosine1402-N4)-methyltransferase
MIENIPHRHCPVLVKEVLRGLDVHPQGLYVDGTIGGGGHSKEILECAAPHGRVLGIDLDPDALERAKKNLRPYGDRVVFQKGNYVEIARILGKQGIKEAQGVLLDLGVSYEQLTSGGRGFSFKINGPLDMRFSPESPVTAEQIVNHRSEIDLKHLFESNGEERWAARIARAIIRSRPIRSTGDLAQLVVRVVPQRGRIHPATRVFQALRIEVNQELENVEKGVSAAAACLARAGRLCVISYHSLEDRLVKQHFRYLSSLESGKLYKVLTTKPIKPSRGEVSENPRARSAKLRILEKVGGG